MKELPRDINAGAMAAALFESGVYGKEIEFCAALSWDGSFEQLRYESELACCKDLIRRFNAGELVSDFGYCSKRVEFEADEEQVRAELFEETLAPLKEPFEQRVATFQDASPASREEAFAAYFESLPEDRRALINGLLGIGLQRKWVSPEFAQAWRQDEREPEGKVFAGFAYMVDGEIKHYINAYVPDVWKRWRKTNNASALFVDGVKGYGSIPQLRGRFEERFKTLYDAEYFALLEE